MKSPRISARGDSSAQKARKRAESKAQESAKKIEDLQRALASLYDKDAEQARRIAQLEAELAHLPEDQTVSRTKYEAARDRAAELEAELASSMEHVRAQQESIDILVDSLNVNKGSSSPGANRS